MATSFIPPTDLDFAAYKQSLKTFLSSQARFSDYDFEGSNLSALLDLLAYNAYNQAHYLNMVGSEMFLDTAQIRESIVSHAKELNYVPRSRISARANVTVEVVPTGSPTTVTIPKYYAFKTNSSTANSLRFITDQPVVIRRSSSGRYISDEITVYEGYVVTESFTVLPTTTENGSVIYNQRFNLRSENIDVTSIEVTVQQDSNDLNPVTYTRATDLYGLDDESTIFFVRGYKDNYYELEFGDGVLGAALAAGNIVTVRYRDTIGDDGNGSYVFTKTASIDGFSDITVTTQTRATGGSERESNDSIKYNSVRHFQVQNRAVIPSDYESLIKTNFPEIQQVNVYGGEEIYQYGKVIIIPKPYNIDGVVEQATKDRIVAFLKTKNIVPEPVIHDPEYFYVGVTANVHYNYNATTARENELKGAITDALVELNTTTLTDFEVDVHQSLLTGAIMDAHTSFTGCSVLLSMIRRWTPEVGVSTSYTFTTNNPLLESHDEHAYLTTDLWGVSTNVFKMIIDDEIEDVLLRDNGVGDIHIYIVESGGSLVKVPTAIGTVDYDTGEVLVTIDPYEYTTYISFQCKLRVNDIHTSRDTYMVMDSTDITINLVHS